MEHDDALDLLLDAATRVAYPQTVKSAITTAVKLAGDNDGEYALTIVADAWQEVFAAEDSTAPNLRHYLSDEEIVKGDPLSWWEEIALLLHRWGVDSTALTYATTLARTADWRY
jgi:hypothetical protein